MVETLYLSEGSTIFYYFSVKDGILANLKLKVVMMQLLLVCYFTNRNLSLFIGGKLYETIISSYSCILTLCM